EDVHRWSAAVRRLHRRKVAFVNGLLPKPLHGRYGCPSRQVKFVTQKNDISGIPVVTSNTGAPVDHAELPSFNLPFVFLSVAVGVLEALIIIRPVRNALLVN